MSRVGELSVDITADTSRLRAALAGITGSGGSLAAIGTAAVAAVAVATAAIVGFGVAAVREFADFDTKMREVFTLLPDITAEAMDEMEAEVLAFSREFGKLPDEVIPALYAALSAGVPADNVFAFLETANALAIGGVSDLQAATAVLAGSVNAYGAEMLTYGEASDALFTAVRLGVTTIPELAATIGRVTPIASDLGIKFDTVAAMLATLTTVFPSTAEAATGLRTMLAELGKEGSTAFSVFAAATGTTFPEFIAGGGTVEEALTHLGDYADTNGVRVGDLFGSIEAGMAATVLTSESGSAKLGIALDAMGEKAGATQAAFETMDGGIQASWNRLQAGFNTLMVEVGDKLAPMFQAAVNTIVTDVMPLLRDFVLGVFVAITTATEALTAAWNKYQTDTDGIFATVRTTVELAGAAITAVFEVLAVVWDNILKPAWEAIAPAVGIILGVVTTVIHAALEAITGIMRALAAFLSGDWEGAWRGMSDAVTAITAGLRDALYGIFNGLKEWLGQNARDIATNAGINWAAVVDAIKSAVGGIVDWMRGVFDNVVAIIQSAIDGVMAAAQRVMDFVDRVMGRARSAESAARDAAAALSDAEASGSTGGSTGGGSRDYGGGTADMGRDSGGDVPRFATGGIVTSAMHAIVGEAGPEAIIPLDRLENLIGGGNQTIIIELDGHQIMRSIAPRMVGDLRLRTGIA